MALVTGSGRVDPTRYCDYALRVVRARRRSSAEARLTLRDTPLRHQEVRPAHRHVFRRDGAHPWATKRRKCRGYARIDAARPPACRKVPPTATISRISSLVREGSLDPTAILSRILSRNEAVPMIETLAKGSDAMITVLAHTYG